MAAPLLLVQTAFLGDLLLSGLLLREMRRARPHAPIHLFCRKGFGTVMKALGLVDEIHEIKKGDRQSYRQIKNDLKDLKFEWVICPHPSLRSALFIQSLFAGQSVSYGQVWNHFLFSKTVPRKKLPDPLRQLALLTPLVPELRQRFEKYEQKDWNATHANGLLSEIPQELLVDCREILQKVKPPAPIAPRTWILFPGSVWATKQWPEESFLQLAEKLLAENCQVLWLGGPDEAAVCQRLAEKVPQTRSLAGQLSLWESLVLLSRAEGVIANDSGGQHLAALAGAPVLSIYGPTVVEFGFRAWTRFSAICEVQGLFCRPCGPHGHKRCPRGTFECMLRISADNVFAQWQKLVRVIRSRV